MKAISRAACAGSLALGAAAFADPEATPSSFTQAHDRLLAQDDLQFRFDIAEIDAPPPPSGFWRWLIDALDAAEPVFVVLFWVLVGLAAASIIGFILREAVFSRWRSKRGGTAAPVASADDFTPTQSAARALLSEADSLAAAGLHAEAVRVILHRSIADIEERRPRLIRAALTAREISRLAGLPDRPREAYEAIAACVERAWFAGRPIGADDYASCRSAYERFAFSGAPA